MIEDYTIEVRASTLNRPIVYRLAVYFGLIIGWSCDLRDLVGVCAHDFGQFAEMCAELGWVLSKGSEVS